MSGTDPQLNTSSCQPGAAGEPVSIGKTLLSLILPLYMPSTIFSIARSLLIPVLPLFASDFDVPYTLVGLLLSADKIGMLVGDLPAGMLIRKLGIKRAMISGIIVAGISTVALFWSFTVYDAFLYLFLAGFGTSLYTVTRHTWIVGAVPIDQRGRALGVLGGVFRIGNFIGPMAGGAIAGAFGLRVPFLFFGLAFLAALIANAIFLPKLDTEKDVNGEKRHLNIKSLREIFGDMWGTVTWAGTGFFFMQMVRSGPSIIIPLYAANVLNLDVQSIGLILSLSSAVDMTLFLPAGFIMDWLGRKVSIISSAVLLSLGIALIPVSTGFTSLMWVSLLIGFGNGLGAGAMLTLGADLAPENFRAEFLGFWRLLGDAGGTGGPIVIGAIAEIFVLSQTTLAIAAAGVMASLVFAFRMKETLAKRAPGAAKIT
jgi:MFS family permease